MLYSFAEIGDEQLGPAVAVDVLGVDPHAGLGPPVDVVGRAAILGDIAKRAVAVVQIKEMRIPVVGDVEVGLAVAVEVGRDEPRIRAHPPGRVRPCRSRR